MVNSKYLHALNPTQDVTDKQQHSGGEFSAAQFPPPTIHQTVLSVGMSLLYDRLLAGAPESRQRAGSWRTRHKASHSTWPHTPPQWGRDYATPLSTSHSVPQSQLGCTGHMINTIATSVNYALTILAGDAVVSRSRHQSQQADVRMRTKCSGPIWGQLVRGNQRRNKRGQLAFSAIISSTFFRVMLM